jgi:hypothetical protein
MNSCFPTRGAESPESIELTGRNFKTTDGSAQLRQVQIRHQ